MNHQDTKAPRESIPKETNEVASKIVDPEIQIERPCSVPAAGLKGG